MKFNLKEVFQPKLFELFGKGQYDGKTFTSDLIAGIIVGIIALPLAIAFGIASGVTPQQGLITAIVAGFLISFFGGSNFLIGGPTGAFIVIVAGIVAQYGMQGLIIATIMAGVFLIVMGVCKMGVIFKFIPYPIVVGFTSGIALTIFSTQMKDFFGLPLDLQVPAGFIPQWICYFQNISHINWVELVMSIICLIICFSWGKVTKKVPGSLIALIIGTAISVVLSKFGGIELATIGSKFPELADGLPMPSQLLLISIMRQSRVSFHLHSQLQSFVQSSLFSLQWLLTVLQVRSIMQIQSSSDRVLQISLHRSSAVFLRQEPLHVQWQVSIMAVRAR